MTTATQTVRQQKAWKITCKRCHHSYIRDIEAVQVMFKGRLHWLCNWCAAEVERNGEQ